MTAIDLKTIRCAMDISAAEMARAMKTPLRTYQDWEAGVNRIPGVAEVAATLLIERMNWSMGEITKSIDSKVSQAYADGVRNA